MLQQKRSELLRLLFIVALLALTVGVVLVLSANNPSATQVTTPSFINASANHSINITVSNPAGSTELKGVRIVRPNSFSKLDCGARLPAGWSCTDNDPDEAKFTTTGTGITAGTSVSFMINGIAPSTTGNNSFDVNTFEDSSAISGFNYTVKANVTVDADAPLIGAINISDGLRVWNGSAPTMWVNGSALVINVSISDVHSGINASSVYYNFSNYSLQPVVTASLPHPTDAGSYHPSVLALTAAGNAYTATIPANMMINGTIVYFTIVANDTVKNKNVTNSTVTPTAATATFNVSVDSAAPRYNTFNLSGFSSVFTYNVTTSSTVVNISLTVFDDGGSGISSVELNTSDAPTTFKVLNLTNNNKYNYSGPLSGLGVTTGDHKLRMGMRAIDNVGNTIIATVMDLEVDDDAPQFSLNSNYSNNFTSTNNSQINITARISNNLNLTHNVTINGPNGLIFNASLNVGTVTSAINDTSTWFTVKLNDTGGIFPTAETGNHTLSFSNLSQYGCPGGAETDGFVCQLQLNATDIFGRSNSTNITITLDNVAPAIVNITMNNTAASARSNIVFKGGTQLNFTANAYNNIVNVTIGNRSITSFSHVMPTVAGNYSFLINVSDFCVGQGACSINFSATDKAGNYNNSLVDSEGASFLILRDDEVPVVENISISLSVGNLSNITEGMGIINPVRIARSTKLVNITADSVDYNGTSTVTSFTLQNATAVSFSSLNADNSSWSVSTTLGSLGCSASVESQCIITFNSTDNASNVNNSIVSPQLNLTFRVDDLTPRVLNFSTSLISGIGRNVTSVTTDVINFSVNISDANLWNVTIQNTTVRKMNSSGSTTSNTTTVTYWIMSSLTDLGCTSNGDCYVTINSTDLAGNINASQSITITVDSSPLNITNLTDGGSLAVFYFDSTPTFSVNTSKAAICRYSTTGIRYFSQMTAPFDNNGTRHSSATLPATADGIVSYRVACVDVAGVNEVTDDGSFTIDTINDTAFIIDNSTQNVVYYFDNTPTITVNLTANALCRYSSTGGGNYTTMTTPFTVNGTRHNSFTLGTTADGSYTYPVACATANEQNVVSGTVTFTVDTVNDTALNISNSTQNVVFYFDNTPTITVNLSDNALCRYSSNAGVFGYGQMTAPFDVNGTKHNSFTLAATADGSYTYPVACTTANEQNEVRGTVTFTVDTINDTTIAISNITDTGSTFIATKPTVHVNLSANALCRYSGAGGTYVFSDMTSPFNVNGTRHNSFTVASDLRDNDYAYPVACTTSNGQNNVTGTVRFAVDTTSLWNITVGATGSLSATKDYFTQANKFYTFRLPKTNVLATTAVNARYNVTDVLASVMGASPGTAATNNLSVIYAYNRTGNSWSSFVYGRTTNTLTNFTSDVMDYYINFTVANERIEIN